MGQVDNPALQPTEQFESDVSKLMPKLDELVKELSSQFCRALEEDRSKKNLLSVKNLFEHQGGIVSLEDAAKTADMKPAEFLQYFAQETNFSNQTGLDFEQAAGILNFYNHFRQTVVNRVFQYYARLGRFMSYVQKNISEKISLDEAANIGAMERTYFSIFFHDKVGQTFRDFLRNYRVAKSMDLMATKDYNFSELTGAVGYGDLRLFERAFKRDVGITPSKFKHLVIVPFMQRNPSYDSSSNPRRYSGSVNASIPPKSA